jgi:hypothetical protein
LGFERRVDAAIYRSALKTKVGSKSSEHGIVATSEIVIVQAAVAENGMYGSWVIQSRWSRTASLRATATTALLLACLPPLAAR